MNNTNFTLNFDPTEALKIAERQLAESFRRSVDVNVASFFSTNKESGYGGKN